MESYAVASSRSNHSHRSHHVIQILARKELNYGRMDERDLKQLTEEVYALLDIPTLLEAHFPGRNILEQLGSNDNIVRYHERFVDKPNNMLYILMEYCEGGDLAGVIQRCRKSGSVPFRLVARALY